MKKTKRPTLATLRKDLQKTLRKLRRDQDLHQWQLGKRMGHNKRNGGATVCYLERSKAASFQRLFEAFTALGYTLDIKLRRPAAKPGEE